MALAKTLGTRGTPASERSYALPWLIHLVGDAHQPLHTSIRLDAEGKWDKLGNGTDGDQPVQSAQAAVDAARLLGRSAGPVLAARRASRCGEPGADRRVSAPGRAASTSRSGSTKAGGSPATAAIRPARRERHRRSARSFLRKQPRDRQSPRRRRPATGWRMLLNRSCCRDGSAISASPRPRRPSRAGARRVPRSPGGC